MIFSIKYIKNGGIYMDKTVLSILLFVLGLGIGLALVFLFNFLKNKNVLKSICKAGAFFMNNPDFYTNHGSTVTLPLQRGSWWG